jgi:hypothetical protein
MYLKEKKKKKKRNGSLMTRLRAVKYMRTEKRKKKGKKKGRRHNYLFKKKCQGICIVVLYSWF